MDICKLAVETNYWPLFEVIDGKWRMLSTTTGTYINAGYYKVVLSAPDMEGLALDALDVQ